MSKSTKTAAVIPQPNTACPSWCSDLDCDGPAHPQNDGTHFGPEESIPRSQAPMAIFIKATGEREEWAKPLNVDLRQEADGPALVAIRVGDQPEFATLTIPETQLLWDALGRLITYASADVAPGRSLRASGTAVHDTICDDDLTLALEQLGISASGRRAVVLVDTEAGVEVHTATETGTDSVLALVAQANDRLRSHD